MLKKAKSIWVNEFVNPIKSIRISYLPPLMIYFAAGVSGLTGVVQGFFVTKVLGLTPEFLAVLGYWAGVWWAFKMPIGHLVDLFWRFKAVFVFLGAILMAFSMAIMIGLTGHIEFMTKIMSAETWFVISVLVSPFAYVLQDIVADAMTAEAVPRVNDDGTPVNEKTLHAAHTDMQLLGRAAQLFGILIVAGAGGWFAKMPAVETGYILLKIILGVLLLFCFLRFVYLLKYKCKHYLSELRIIYRILLTALIFSVISAIGISFLGIFIFLADIFYKLLSDSFLSGIKPYEMVYCLALIIPMVSVSGVIFAFFLKRKKMKILLSQGFSAEEVNRMLDVQGEEKTKVNWWILGGSLVYVIVLIPMGLLSLSYRMGTDIIPFLGVKISSLPFGIADWLPSHSDDILFFFSMVIICFLIAKITAELPQDDRRVLLGTAAIVFVFRMIPSAGAGLSFFNIEVLHFDEAFQGTLSQIGSIIALAGLFFFRPLMAKKSLIWTFCFLTILYSFFMLPTIGLVHGVHEWLACYFGADPLKMARSIALIDTVAESPFGQLAMVPMLAWIAREAPAKYKATYFALMASFSNLALSASTLGTKYLNYIFVVEKPVYNKLGELAIPGVYNELGAILWVVTAITFFCPMIAVLLFSKINGKEAIFFRIKDRITGKRILKKIFSFKKRKN